MALTITDGVALLKRLAGTSLGMLTLQLGGKTNVISDFVRDFSVASKPDLIDLFKRMDSIF